MQQRRQPNVSMPLKALMHAYVLLPSDKQGSCSFTEKNEKQMDNCFMWSREPWHPSADIKDDIVKKPFVVHLIPTYWTYC